MGHSADSHGSGFAHPTPISLLLGVFAALVVLTFATVYQSTLELGAAEIWASLAIATVKAALVILFFMHLWWDKPFNAILFISSLVFVALFLGFTLVDAHGVRSTVELIDTLPVDMPGGNLP